MGEWILNVLSIPWVGVLIGLVLFLLSLPVSYFFYQRGKRTNDLSYAETNLEVIAPREGASSKLEVRYDGAVVPRVTTTVFGFWNSGTETISGDQIVERDPLRISADEKGVLLEADVRGLSREVIGVSAKLRGSRELAIDFDYLDPGDGFVINVVHSGDKGSLTLLGSVRGLPRGLSGNRRRGGNFLLEFFRVIIAIPVIAAVQLPFFMIVEADKSSVSIWFLVLAAAALLSFAVAAALFGPGLARRFRLRGIPGMVGAVVELEAIEKRKR